MEPPRPPDLSPLPSPHASPKLLKNPSSNSTPDSFKSQRIPQENPIRCQISQPVKELYRAGNLPAQGSASKNKEEKRKQHGVYADQAMVKANQIGEKETNQSGEFQGQGNNDLDPSLADVEQKNGGNFQVSSSKGQHLFREDLDLSAIMRSLQITIPEEVEIGYQEEQIQRPEVNSPFKLLMKVACSSGAPRNIPLQALNNAMQKAWGDNYWIIDQIKPAIYIAYFKNDEAMDFVLKRQPWSLDSDNLLLEWINPRETDMNADTYQFRYVYVPIRVYGVPERFRTPHLMRYVLDKVAHLSDLHPPPEITLIVKKDYLQAYAKMDINIPVKDKVKYYVTPNEYILFYLNYDKIKRICIFCGLMFHSVQHCPNRRKLIMHLQSIKASTDSVPFSYVGIWTSQATKIPQIALDQSNILGGPSLEYRRFMKADKSLDANIQLTHSQDHVNRALMLSHPTAGVLNPSTCAATNRQHSSDISVPQKSLKRQTETEALPAKESRKVHGQTRLRSIPPVSPQHSATASSPPTASVMHDVYRPPHLRYGQHPGSAVDGPISHQSPPASQQLQVSTCKFNEGTAQPPLVVRRKFRSKRRNRWDERRTGSEHNITFHSIYNRGIPNNYIFEAVQQAQQIATNTWNSSNTSIHLEANMRATEPSASMPPKVQQFQDLEQYKQRIENVAVSTLGPVSVGDYHGGLQPPNFTGQPLLAVNDTNQVYGTANEEKAIVCTEGMDMDNIESSNFEGIEDNLHNSGNQAAAPALKAPQAQ